MAAAAVGNTCNFSLLIFCTQPFQGHQFAARVSIGEYLMYLIHTFIRNTYILIFFFVRLVFSPGCCCGHCSSRRRRRHRYCLLVLLFNFHYYSYIPIYFFIHFFSPVSFTTRLCNSVFKKVNFKRGENAKKNEFITQ